MQNFLTKILTFQNFGKNVIFGNFREKSMKKLLNFFFGYIGYIGYNVDYQNVIM